jgi:hypothetical protein
MPTSNCKYRQENMKEKKKKKKGKKRRKTNIWQKMGHLYHCKKKSISFARKIGASMKQKEVNPKNPFIN